MPGKKQEQRPDLVSRPGCTHATRHALHTRVLLSDLQVSYQVSRSRELIPEVMQ